MKLRWDTAWIEHNNNTNNIDLPHTVASNMGKVSHALTHSATAAVHKTGCVSVQRRCVSEERCVAAEGGVSERCTSELCVSETVR